MVHLADFTAWLRNEGAGNTGKHNAVKSYFYWCYNANSGGERGRDICIDSCTERGWVGDGGLEKARCRGPYIRTKQT